MIIDVVFFKLPNGEKTVKQIEIRGVDQKYRQVADAGCIITIEYLRTGELSICIEEPDIGDFDGVIIAGDKSIGVAVEHLIGRFDLEEFNEWKLDNLN